MASFAAGEADAGNRQPDGARIRQRRGRLIGGLGVAALIVAAVWMMLTGREPATRPIPRGRSFSLLTVDRPFPAGGRFPSDPFVGAQGCRECHPGECALHSRSGHARTLATAAKRRLAREVDGTVVPDPEYPGVSWQYRYRDGRLLVGRRSPAGVEEIVAEYAFGSGNHAVTFVNMVDPETPVILEHRMTYYTRTGTFGLTPGHETVPKPPGLTPLGGLPPPVDARSCFECHSTQVSTSKGLRIEEDRLIPGVSCERCHGPGRAHVEAARRGAPAAELRLPFGTERGYTAEQVVTLCGSCHRNPQKPGVGPLDPENPHLARFQPVGIIQSRCFRESRGGFSCVTCHDPHARASTDRAAYNATCRSCHAGTPTDALASAVAANSHVTGRPCPVQPDGDCIGCHMPRVDAGQGVLFADHWIRRRSPAGGTAPGNAPRQPGKTDRP